MANAPTQHAKLSPSGAHRWMACPGSVVLSKGIADRGSDYSTEGTAAHELAAWALQDQAHITGAYVGRITDNGVEVTDDMARDVQYYVDNVLEYAYGNTLMVEQPLPIGHLTGETGAEGTGDAVIITADETELQVHDLKFGRGVAVHARENEQLMMYALGALHKYGVVADFQQVRLVIHQPRQDTRPREWVVSVEDLLAFGEQIDEAAHKVRQVETGLYKTDIFLNPGKKQCQWCKAAGTCPALGRKVKVELTAELEELACDADSPLTEEEAAAAVAAVPTITHVPSADTLDMVENWIKAVRGHIEGKLFAGIQLPGWKLVEGKQGDRKWVSEAATATMLKSFRLKIEEMHTLKLISPAQAEKLLAKAFPRRWKKLQTLYTRSNGKPSVAPESDPRPALVLVTAADDLADLAVDEPLA